MNKTYFNNDPGEFLSAVATFPVWDITNQALVDQVISDIKGDNHERINARLRDSYLNNFQKAVAGVMSTPEYGDKYFDSTLLMQNNVERLANFKAYQATEQLRTLSVDDPEFDKKARGVINAFNRFQTTEYNTITARARTARQWEGFKERRALYPNIMWLPSRSAEPREEHAEFYYKVWPQDDPFWNANTPGSLWNCKCDWEETDKPVTDNSDIESVAQAAGLEGNPGITGELITDKHPYISSTKRSVKEDISGEIIKSVRSRMTHQGIEKLKGKTVAKTILEKGIEKTIEIGLNRKGIEHFAHDFCSEPNFKNSLIPHLDKVIKSAKYENSAKNDKSTNTEVFRYHYFSFEMLKQTFYINVREMRSGKFLLYALTHSIG